METMLGSRESSDIAYGNTLEKAKNWEFDFNSAETEAIANCFHEYGFVCLRNVDSLVATIEEWSNWSRHFISETFASLHSAGHTDFPAPQREKPDGTVEFAMGQGVRHGFREIVMRSPGRYEISLIDCKDHPSLLEIQQQLNKAVCSIMDVDNLESLHLCHVSIVVASPSASDQGWHVDGGHVDLQRHLQCHSMNIFLPLVDISSENGPTELRPGSHLLTRNLTHMMLAAKARRTLQPPVLPLLPKGDVLMFDYRTLHRGRANRTYHDRPLLVLTYAMPWFKDTVNFPSRRIREA